MSYCRFSTDDFQCDVYVYADVAGGYTTHVAVNRVVFAHPLPPPVPMQEVDAFLARHRQMMALIDTSPREPILLEHAGERFNDDTAAECAARLTHLRALGYRVPDGVIEALRETADTD